jgi:hypothetical protein
MRSKQHGVAVKAPGSCSIVAFVTTWGKAGTNCRVLAVEDGWLVQVTRRGAIKPKHGAFIHVSIQRTKQLHLPFIITAHLPSTQLGHSYTSHQTFIEIVDA